MAVSDALAILKELNKDKASRRKTASNQLMQMTKLSNEKDIKLMSTKITYADRKRTALQDKYDKSQLELDTLNESLSLTLGDKERITNKIDVTTGSIDAANDIKSVLSLIQEENSVLRKNISSQNEAITLGKQKLGHYNALGEFFAGKGISDFDKSGTIDEKDATLSNYFKSKNIDKSTLDPSVMSVLESLDKTGYRNIDAYIKADADYKQALQTRADVEEGESDDAMSSKITMISSRGMGDYTKARNQFALGVQNDNYTKDELDVLRGRYNESRFAIASDMYGDQLIDVVGNTTVGGEPFTNNPDAFLNEFFKELRDNFGYDTEMALQTIDADLKNVEEKLGKKKISNKDRTKLQNRKNNILVKRDVLKRADGVTKRYLSLFNEATNENTPVYKGLIDETEAIYGKFLESSGEQRNHLQHVLRNYFGFDPSSREDVNWMNKEQNKSLNDVLNTLGADEVDVDEESDENILAHPFQQIQDLSTRDENFGFIKSDGSNASKMWTDDEFANYLAGYGEEVGEDKIIVDEGKGDDSGEPTLDDINSINNELDMGSFNPEIGNVGPSSDDYDTNDLSFLYEPITEGSDSTVVLDSLGNFTPMIDESEKEFNDYLESGQNFIYANDNISMDNPLNIMEDSLGTIPTGSITLSDTGAEFSGKMNWVTGEIYNESDGRYIGNLQHDNEALTNIRYNDGSSILASKFPSVKNAEVTDKDYVRMVINHPDYNLREKLDSGYITKPADFIKYLRDFVEKDPNYKFGVSEAGVNKAIDLLELFPWEEEGGGFFGWLSGKQEGSTINFIKSSGKQGEEQDALLEVIAEIMKEYKGLKNPSTYQSDIDTTRSEYANRDDALVGLDSGELTQQQIDRAFPIE
tara:strand:+ start:6295 stop:8898 length:2604 start_codon:yes stop_codon:yes gene_type:complete